MDTVPILHTPPPHPTITTTVKRRNSATVPNPPQKHPKPDPTDSVLQSFLSLSDPTAVNLSFDRVFQSQPSDPDQLDLIERAIELGSALIESARRAERTRFGIYNGVVWPLSHDITIKVFSMLDTQSVCYVAATCSFFQKCAMDPLCYADIDLTSVVPKVNNAVVSTMIQRAGKSLRSIKLGVVSGPPASFGSSKPLMYSIRNSVDVSEFSWNDKRLRQGKESCVLTRSCLASLIGDAGARLRILHLYNIERMDNNALYTSLSVCPSLLDLEIVGLCVELRQTLESVSKHCPFLERLYFESSKTGRDDGLKYPTCNDFVQKCPNLTSLSLRGFKLHDYKARMLLKGFSKLKYVDFSTSYSFTGAFLKNLGGSLLEVLILRDCVQLKEGEIDQFMSAVLGGEFKQLRHLDISNREGLATEGDWRLRCCSTSFIPIKQLLEQRPGFCLVAEFPEASIVEGDEYFIDYDLHSDISMPTQRGSHTSDESLFISSSDSLNSDPGSGNEDIQEASFVMHAEVSDEVFFL